MSIDMSIIIISIVIRSIIIMSIVSITSIAPRDQLTRSPLQ